MFTLMKQSVLLSKTKCSSKMKQPALYAETICLYAEVNLQQQETACFPCILPEKFVS